MKREEALLWIDILVLRLIMDEQNPPSRIRLYHYGDHSGLINEFLATHSVDPIYAAPLRSTAQIGAIIGKLRSLGFIGDEQPYQVTRAGAEFMRKSIPRRWQYWPLRVPIRNGVLDFSGRIEAPDL